MKRLRRISESTMSVLIALCKERREWPQKKRAIAVHHRHAVHGTEIALFLGFLILLCVYLETIRIIIQPVWKYVRPFMN